MPLLEAEAIVLRRYPLSDSDRLVVFMTREYGRLRAAASGARKPKSQLGAALEPFQHLRVQLALREGKELGQVRGAEILDALPGKNADFASLCTCSYCAELVNEIVPENQPNQALFRLLLASLKAVTARGPTVALARYFELWALRLNGLLPDFSRCSVCGKHLRDEPFRVSIEAGEAGAARCDACAGGSGLPLGAKSAAMLEKMMKLPPEEIMIVPFGEETEAELERLAQRLLSFHLEKQLKSWPALREALHS